MTRAVPTRFGRVSPLAVDWRRGVTETYEFKTDVIVSRNGLESRSALREDPRYSLEHETQLHREEVSRYLGDLAEQQHRPFHVPLGWRRVFLAAPVSAGASTVDVTSTPSWLVAGRRLILSGGGQVEAVEVVSISGATLTLDGPLEGSFSAGAIVTFAFSGRAQDDVGLRAETGRMWRGKVVWEADPGADPWPGEAASPTLHEGREVFLRRPNWRSRPRITIQQMREMVDQGRGIVAISAPTAESQLELRLLYSGFDAAAADELAAFFLRMKGKRGSFWMPTWQQDLTPTGGSGTSLTIAGEDAFYAYAGSRVFNTVAVRHPGGAYQINRVADVALASGDTVFTMADSWSSPVTESSLVSWCPLWRFATDRLEVERETGSVANMNFSVVSLIQEPA